MADEPPAATETYTSCDQEVPFEVHDARLPIGLPSVYVSVFLAAFGGVTWKLPDESQVRKVNPCLLLLPCFAIFVVQLTALTCLRFSLDVNAHLWEPDELMSREATGESHNLLTLKILLVVAVYMMNFQVLMESLNHIVFLLNPLTWAEIVHPSPDQWVLFKHSSAGTRTLLGCSRFLEALLALVMNLIVNYIVCTDSSSMILSCQGAKDAVFNALAITFIVDLGMYAWDGVRYIFSLSDITEFSFQLYDPEELWDGDKLKQHGPAHARRMSAVVDWLSACAVGRRLRLNHGGRYLMKAISSILLCFAYFWQFVVITDACVTNTLPVALEICTKHPGMRHEMTLGSRLTAKLSPILLIDFEYQMLRVFDTCAQVYEYQQSPEYLKLPITELIVKYWHSALGLFLVLVLGVLMPSTVNAFCRTPGPRKSFVMSGTRSWLWSQLRDFHEQARDDSKVMKRQSDTLKSLEATITSAIREANELKSSLK